MRTSKWGLIALMLCLAAVLMTVACDDLPAANAPQSSSGVTKADVKLSVGADGLTVEQRNVKQRLLEDNKPGAIKHLYVISPYSGQVILYSTVKGKVTSGGKRLTPTQVSVFGTDRARDAYGFNVDIAGTRKETPEVLQDDGTYGSSGEYLYWWDVRGAYHQHYLTGGQIITISDQPLPVKSVTINIEAASKE